MDSVAQCRRVSPFLTNRFGQVEVVRLLLTAPMIELNGPTAYFSNTPLHLAMQNNRTEIGQLLVNANAKVDMRNIMGRTPWDIVVMDAGDSSLNQGNIDVLWPSYSKTPAGKNLIQKPIAHAEAPKERVLVSWKVARKEKAPVPTRPLPAIPKGGTEAPQTPPPKIKTTKTNRSRSLSLGSKKITVPLKTRGSYAHLMKLLHREFKTWM